MTFWDRWRALFVFGPIAVLLLMGLVVSIRSGVAGRGDAKDLRQVVVNLTSVALRVVGYVAGMMVVQELIGVRLDFGL